MRNPKIDPKPAQARRAPTTISAPVRRDGESAPSTRAASAPPSASVSVPSIAQLVPKNAHNRHNRYAGPVSRGATSLHHRGPGPGLPPHQSVSSLRPLKIDVEEIDQ